MICECGADTETGEGHAGQCRAKKSDWTIGTTGQPLVYSVHSSGWLAREQAIALAVRLLLGTEATPEEIRDAQDDGRVVARFDFTGEGS